MFIEVELTGVAATLVGRPAGTEENNYQKTTSSSVITKHDIESLIWMM